MTSVRNKGAAHYDDEAALYKAALHDGKAALCDDEAALCEAALYGDEAALYDNEAALCGNEVTLCGGAVATDKSGVDHDVACVCKVMATDQNEWCSLGAGAHDALSAVATEVALADR